MRVIFSLVGEKKINVCISIANLQDEATPNIISRFKDVLLRLLNFLQELAPK